MSSSLFMALFAVLMGGATVLMLAILVGLCVDNAKGMADNRTAWLARFRSFCQADVSGRSRSLNSYSIEN